MTQAAVPEFPLRMTDAEASFFSECLETAKVYLEFGAGGSTILACHHKISAIVSVETDGSWVQKLKGDDVVAVAVAQRRLQFLHIDVGPVSDWGYPSTDAKIRHWPQYYTGPYLQLEHEYDLILIDGRFRVPCLLTAAMFASEDCGVLVHDYGFRHIYTIAEKYFDTETNDGTLFLLRRRPRINQRALMLDLLSNLFARG